MNQVFRSLYSRPFKARSNQGVPEELERRADGMTGKMARLRGAVILLPMQKDPLVEWQRLTETYGKMYDAELLELAEDSGNLTETAQQVLSDEMRKRGLALARTAGAPRRSADPMLEWAAAAPGANPEAPELVADTPGTDDEGDAAQEYTWKTLLCECETGEEALQLAAALRHSGIESWIEGRGGTYSPFAHVDQGFPKILVPADRLEEAREIAANPIPKEIVEQSHIEVPEFEAPVCPKCGAEDPVLEGVDPVNSWFCEACENEWTETAANAKENPEKAE
jgi:hypothetical protein